MGQGPLCYIPKFIEIGPLVPKKKILAFYHIYVWKPSDHVTNIILTYFHFPLPQSLHTKFGQKSSRVQVQILLKMAHWFLRKTSFNFDVNDLGQKSRNDLDLEYTYTFIYSSSCLHLPMFRSQAAIVSKKSTVYTFSYRKV